MAEEEKPDEIIIDEKCKIQVDAMGNITIVGDCNGKTLEFIDIGAYVDAIRKKAENPS